ncbi:MAG: flagellar hook-basal body complex protein FliE [Rhodospirillaceae bacterium]|nr:flagellar hook-basal body complex protein FliE [Rhodospirillaceae bacterium]
MAIDPMSAAAAYRANATGPNMFHTGSQPQAQPASGSSFLDMVKGVAEDAMQSNYKAEEVTARGMAGQANVTEVVTALAEAESTLSTVVTVRDRVISAYQEILRMPI